MNQLSKKLSKKCKKMLSDKIKVNMNEYKNKTVLKNKKRFKNRSQVIAVSYSQLKKYYPKCFKQYIIQK